MVAPALQPICGQLDHLPCKACSVSASVPESNIKPSYFPGQGQRVLEYLKATPSHLPCPADAGAIFERRFQCMLGYLKA